MQCDMYSNSIEFPRINYINYIFYLDKEAIHKAMTSPDKANKGSSVFPD